MKRFLLHLLAMVSMGFSSICFSQPRYQKVIAYTPEPYSMVKVTAVPLSGVPGCQTEQYILSDANRKIAIKVPVFMGENLITIKCGGGSRRRTVSCLGSAPRLRVQLEWEGHDNQDYDIYVNGIFSSFSPAENGGVLDWDHWNDITAWSSWEVKNIAETVTYQQALGGVYKLSANYYGDTAGGA